jgi:hypothetical protein
MQKYRNQIIWGLILSLAIYVGALILFDSQGQFTEGVGEALRGFPWWMLLPITLVQSGAFVTRFLLWQYYMGVIGARERLSLRDSAIIFVAGFVMVVSPGKAAELLKAVLVKVKSGVPVARTVPVVLAERVNDGIAVLILLAATLILAGSQLALDPATEALSRAIIFGSTALIAAGLVAVQVRPLGEFILSIIDRLPLIKRAGGWFRELYESSREVFKLRHVGFTLIYGVGTYLFTAATFVLILWAFGISPTLTVILQATFIVGIGSAIGALSFIPNGAGITEISQGAMLLAIVAPANPELTIGVAAAAALMEGFFHKWLRVVVGLVVVIIWRDELFTTSVEGALAEAELEAKHA